MKRKIIVQVLLGIILMTGMLLLTGCGQANKEDTSNDISSNKSTTTNVKDIENNIKIVDSNVGADNRLSAVIKNNNNFDVGMIDLVANFYGSDNSLLNTAKESIFVIGAGREEAVRFYDSAPADYSKYEITIKANDYSSDLNGYTLMNDKVSMQDKDTGDEIDVTFTNNSDQDIQNIDLQVVYYKDGKIVGMDQNYVNDLRAGSSEMSKMHYPYDSNYDDVTFDQYKVFYSAYNNK